MNILQTTATALTQSNLYICLFLKKNIQILYKLLLLLLLSSA